MATKTKLDLTTLNRAVAFGMLHKLNGQGFCQTGSMSITRQEMDQIITALHGRVDSAVKSNTTYLIVPNGDYRKGSKHKAAMQRGTVIITEAEFVNLILPTEDELRGGGSEGSKA